jgi:hypothetical protein
MSNSSEHSEQLKFYHACAEDWCRLASQTRFAESKTACLELAALWQGFATQLEQHQRASDTAA